jgi:hypothetical protein
MTDRKLRSLDLMALLTTVGMSLVPLLPYALEGLAG